MINENNRVINTSYDNGREIHYDTFYKVVMRNLSKLEDNDRYYNWYHGYTEIRLPYITSFFGVYYEVSTAAISGTISTQYFGEKFDADKVETDIYYNVRVYPPASVRNNTNVTLHLDFERVLMKDLSTGQDELSVDSTIVETPYKSFKYSPPAEHYCIELRRYIITADVTKQKLSNMPGFKVTWHFSGMEVEPVARYYNDTKNMAFVRNYSNYIQK